MKKENDKCIIEEINIERTAKVNTTSNSKKNNKQNKVIERKRINSNLNLIISIVIFLIMSIVAIYVILNKGKFGKYSLVYVNDALHTAELECDTYFLSTLDSESTNISLTVDGIKITDGYTLVSSDEDIAKVEDNKIVVGEKEGTAIITAYYEEYDMNISTEVVSYIPINTITATVGSSTIKVGKETSLNIKIIPSNGTDEYIRYTSSDESVATVSDEGVITGVSAGTATITIEDELTGASGTKTITVK